MPYFSFSALDGLGHVEKGSLFATNRREAFSLLNRRYTIVLTLRKENLIQKLWRRLNNNNLFSTEALALLCRQTAYYLDGGIPLISILRLFSEEEKNLKRKSFWFQVVLDYEGGLDLWQCFLPWQDRLQPLLLHVLQAAETAGHPERAFKNLSGYFSRSQKEKKEYLALLAYPILLLCIIFGVGIFLNTFIMPSLIGLYENKSDLPKATQILIGLNNSFAATSLVFILITIIIICVLNFAWGGERLKKEFSRFLISSPILGNFLLKQELMRLSAALSLLLESGIDLAQSWSYALKTITFTYLREMLKEVPQSLEQGLSLYLSLQPYRELPYSFLEYIKHAERGNFLGEALLTLAESYEQENEQGAKNLRRILEPVLIICITLPVGFMAFAVLLPLMAQWQRAQLF